MISFNYAITKKPPRSIPESAACSAKNKPDYSTAVKQYEEYISFLKKAGLEVKELPAEEEYPDSSFVEDPAVVTGKIAVITRLGAPKRQGEEESIKEVLMDNFNQVEKIQPPGTLEGGDVLLVEDTYYVGLSARTNYAGAEQLKEIMEPHGYEVIIVGVPPDILHLKTGLTYLGDNRLLMIPDYKDYREFADYEKIVVPSSEEYASNSLRVNDYVLTPSGYPETKKMLERYYQVLEVEFSEFLKIEGGVTCLSIRY